MSYADYRGEAFADSAYADLCHYRASFDLQVAHRALACEECGAALSRGYGRVDEDSVLFCGDECRDEDGLSMAGGVWDEQEDFGADNIGYVNDLFCRD